VDCCAAAGCGIVVRAVAAITIAVIRAKTFTLVTIISNYRACNTFKNTAQIFRTYLSKNLKEDDFWL
jgi:hypothetical protein